MRQPTTTASSDYLRRASRTVLGGAVFFALVAAVFLVFTIEDKSDFRALAGLVSFFSAVLSIAMIWMWRRGRGMYRRRLEQERETRSPH